MNIKIGLALVSIAAIGAACAPMEQAPLVYTSGLKVGVYAGTSGAKNTPEVSIGVAEDDAAWVPVAVAKHCGLSDQNSQECQDAIYKMRVIFGRNKVDSATPPTRADVQVAAAAYVAAWNNNYTAQNAVNKDSTNLLTDQSVVPVVPASIATDNQKLASDKAAADAALSDLSQKQQALIDVASGDGASNSADAKTDALSVYGTFNSNSSVGSGNGSANAGSVIGKTFSTGVAAQNLTQGLKLSAEVSAVSNCLAAVHTLVADGVAAGKPVAMDPLVALCGIPSK
jgi:hypothetical protein